MAAMRRGQARRHRAAIGVALAVLLSACTVVGPDYEAPPQPALPSHWLADEARAQRLLSTVEQMTRLEDTYAQTRGNIANHVVALYKALGGGWEALAGAPVVKPDIVRQMKARTDWGEDSEYTGGEGRHESGAP